MHGNLEALEKTREYEVGNDKSAKNLPETDLTVLRSLAGNPNVNAGSTETLSEGNAKKKKATVEDEVQSIGQTNTDAGSTKNIVEGSVTGKRKRKRKRIKKVTIEDEGQSTGLTNTVAGSTETLVEGNVTGKRKRKRKKIKKATIEDEVQSMGLANTVAGSTETLVEGNVTGKRKKKRKKIKKAEIKDVNTNVPSSDVKDAEFLCGEKALITSIRRKLLVLDINGLLADVVKPAPRHRRGDIHISGRAGDPSVMIFWSFVFRILMWAYGHQDPSTPQTVLLPFLILMIIIDKVVDYLLGDRKDKLLFCWDMTHSTQTGSNTLENSRKPLVCKELRKIWDFDDPNMRWKKGDYNESNTLLLDDSPYKALLNPLHTAIFPYSYRFVDKNDKSLGPGGDLRVYLEGLLTSENVQKYVEQHPFGQRAINERSSSWEFYARVLRRVSNRLKNGTPVKS
ncbi:hypothetical protein DH2020_012270 [Rehmannia glutinosa]|uniref:Mitochondrial import inner membrane translocase subunit TIM50 n=1 Tax=Rehmannia glutinosa TaxID=99300 RepID=A0ABR0WZB2_REHGL